jgi:hypothetical protein
MLWRRRRRKVRKMAQKLDMKAAIIAMTVLWGGYVFLLGLLTSFGVDNIIWFTRNAVAEISAIYPGFAPTIAGAFIGGIQAVVCAIVGTGIFVWLYNKLAK